MASEARSSTPARAPRRIGVIGAGLLGAAVLRELSAGPASTHNRVVAVLGRRARRLDGELAGIAVLDDIDAFLAEQPELIVELAGPAALAAHGEAALARAPLWTISPAALADAGLHQRLLDVIGAQGHPLRVLHGAIGALDAIGAASVLPAELELRIHVHGEAQTDTELFTGTVREAIGRFPRNINIAAAAALAGPGLDQTRIRVLTPGSAAGRSNQLRISGPLLQAQYEWRPGADAASGLRLTAAAVIRALRALDAPISVG